MKESKSNDVAICHNVKATNVEWLTIKEMVGLPGMPGTKQGCNQKMSDNKKLLANPALKKQVPGSKAFAYHWSLLPVETRDYWSVIHDLPMNIDDAEELDELKRLSYRNLPPNLAKGAQSMNVMGERGIKSMSMMERDAERDCKLIIDVYLALPSDNDKRKLLATVLGYAAELLKHPDTTESTAENDTQSKEILLQSDLNENSSSAPDVSAQNKKAG